MAVRKGGISSCGMRMMCCVLFVLAVAPTCLTGIGVSGHNGDMSADSRRRTWDEPRQFTTPRALAAAPRRGTGRTRKHGKPAHSKKPGARGSSSTKAREAAHMLLAHLNWTDTSICALSSRACKCDIFAETRPLIVNNRVPKCASTTLFQYAIKQVKAYCGPGCAMCVDQHHTDRKYTLSRARRFMNDPLRELCPGNRPSGGGGSSGRPGKPRRSGAHKVVSGSQSTSGKQSRPGILVSHQFFTPYLSDAQRDHVQFFSMVRDTPSRCYSRYFFEHEKKRIFTAESPRKVKGTPHLPHFPDFLSHGKIGSAHPTGSEKSRIALVKEECFDNYLTHWFCGMQEVCYNSHDMRAKLQEAKRVVAEDYALVGLFPHIWESAWLLNVLFPRIFGPLKPPVHYMDATGCSYCNKKSSWHPPKMTPEQREEIDERNPYDKELFAFIERLWHAKMHACARHVLSPDNSLGVDGSNHLEVEGEEESQQPPDGSNGGTEAEEAVPNQPEPMEGGENTSISSYVT